MSIIDSWCQSPDFSWRWAVAKDSPTVKFLSKKSITSEEKSNASLVKVFACMRNALEPISPDDDHVHNSLFKFREVVEERYAKYCRSYCLFMRIWEIFMSIFPGRTSTWSEHKKLLRTIDLKLGLIDHMGSPMVDLNAFALIKPIQNQLNDWKNEFQLQTPCKLMAAIVISQGDKVLYRIYDTENLDSHQKHFDCSYNSPSDNPNQFFDFISSCVKNLPGVVRGFPSGEYKIDMEMISFTKVDSTKIKTFAIRDKVILIDGYFSSTRKLVHSCSTTFSQFRNASFLSSLEMASLKNLKLPSSILDANDNFC